MATEHSPGPWHACHDGKCSCKQIWCNDYPVAKVEAGKWGDEFCSIRLVGDSSLDLKAEAFMDMIEYGTIPEETAIANARFIVKACNSHEELIEALGLAIHHVKVVVEAEKKRDYKYHNPTLMTALWSMEEAIAKAGG